MQTVFHWTKTEQISKVSSNPRAYKSSGLKCILSDSQNSLWSHFQEKVQSFIKNVADALNQTKRTKNFQVQSAGEN